MYNDKNTKPRKVNRSEISKLGNTENHDEMPITEAKKRFSFNWFVNTQQKRTYTLLGITFITFAILMWFAVKPTIETIVELNGKIRSFKQTAQELDLKYQNLLRLTDQYQKSISEGGYKETIEFFDNYALPNNDDIPLLIANLNEYSKTNTIVIDRIEIGEAKESNNLRILPVTIGVEGTMESINNFIANIENFPRPLRITGFNIMTGETKKNIYSADINIEVFSYLSNLQSLNERNEL